MTSKRFTFIEPHFEGDIQIGPKSIATGEGTVEPESDVESEEDGAATTSEDEGGRSAPAVLGVLLVLVIVAVVVKKALGGSEPVDVEDLDIAEE